MIKKRERRFPLSLPIVPEIRLSLWGYTKGVSKTRMAETILINRVSNHDYWKQVCSDLQQEAAILQITVEELIKQILKQDGYECSIDIDGIDWRYLLNNGEPEFKHKALEQDLTDHE